jgi:hypothetical protein
MQLGDVPRFLAVLAAILSELATFGNRATAGRMSALIGFHDLLLVVSIEPGRELSRV